jgi:hypothetical protein
VSRVVEILFNSLGSRDIRNLVLCTASGDVHAQSLFLEVQVERHIMSYEFSALQHAYNLPQLWLVDVSDWLVVSF